MVPADDVNGRGIFVNYRVGDEATTAAFVADALAARFGPEHVFFASRSIRPGDDFAEETLAAIRTSAVLLAVIGDRWLDVTDAHGVRKLDRADDWVYREIKEALDGGVRVVPLLVGSAHLPPDGLPAGISALTARQFLRLEYRRTKVDVAQMIDKLEDLVPDLAKARRGHPDGRAGISVAQRGEEIGLHGKVAGVVVSTDVGGTVDITQEYDIVNGELTGYRQEPPRRPERPE